MFRRRVDRGDRRPAGRHPRIEVCRNERGEAWWRLVAANNRTVCVSETFAGPDAERVAVRQARRMQERLSTAVPVVVTWP
jgi:hypothetical protein